MTESDSPRPQHLGYLDGLRAVAALFVVVHHALLQVDPRQDTLAKWHGGGPLFVFNHGRLAVDLFIVLSGFCLMLPVVRGNGHLRHGTLEFFCRRAWRILPPYYLALGLSLALIWTVIGRATGTHWDVSLPVTAKSIWSHLILQHDALGEDATINHTFWSIAVEWRIYFLFPLLLVAWRRWGAHAAAASAVVASFFLLRLCEKYIHATLTADYLGLFAEGMWGASVTYASAAVGAERIRKLPLDGLALGLGVLAAGVLKAPVHLDGVIRWCLIDYLVGLAFALMLISVSGNRAHPLYRALGWKPLVFVGTFAYSIYLIHAPLLQVLWQMLPPLQTRPWAMFAALVLGGTPLIVACAYGFFLVGERPFLRRRLRTPRSLVAQTAVEPAP